MLPIELRFNYEKKRHMGMKYGGRRIWREEK